MKMISNYVTIKFHVNGTPQESDFEFKSVTLSLSAESGSKDIIVKNLYVSIDPYQINRMKSCSSSQSAIDFAAAIVPGQEIDTYGVGRVEASRNSEFQEGDLVVGLLTWGEYTLVKEGGMINKLPPMGFPLSYHVGILGFSGLTAYGGFFEVCKPKKGETVFVSAATGSVGNLVGQFAKLFGCYVVGCTGSQGKVELLKELGFDDAFNYKEENDLKSSLKRYFPNGIDIYFDNVGGEMLEAAIANMNTFGRVAVCGAISEYTDVKTRAVPRMLDVIYKRIKIQGFLAADYLTKYQDFSSFASDHLRTGELLPLDDISDGVESIPSAFIGLFSGSNVGKKMVKIADE
jgi:NADPH-dependent curcumin reductase CurA